MATEVLYNGVTMYNVMTRGWNQEVQYDNSGADVIGARYTLRFEGTLHFQPSASQVTSAPAYVRISGSSGTDVASARDEIDKRLNEARKDLTIKLDDSTVLYATGSRAKESQPHFDVNNGPKPKRVDVVRIVGTEILQIQFEIEVMKIRCLEGGPPSKFVVNNRWAIEEVTDTNHFTRRDIRGRIRFSTSSISAHAFKALVVPPLEFGFRRESIRFNALENGLEAEYTVTDQQVHTSAPWPATKMQITDSKLTGDGVMWLSDLRVILEAPPDIPKVALFVRAYQIADERLQIIKKLSPDQTGEKAFLVSGALIDHIGEQNKVELQYTLKETAGTDFFDSMRIDKLGSPLKLPGQVPYDPAESLPVRIYGANPHGGDRDMTVLKFLNCYLQDPCSNTHAIGDGEGKGGIITSSQAEQVEGRTQVSGQIVDKLKTYQPTQYTQDHKSAPYTFYRMESTYRNKQMRAHCPIAKTLESHVRTSPSAKTLTLALPLAFREIVIDAERINERPQIIKPLDTYSDQYSGITGTLLDDEITPLPPTPTADGRNLLYRLRARYLYGLDRPHLEDEQVAVGVSPFTNLKGHQTNFKGKDSYTINVRT